ncbi:hypothetical protein Esti_005738 [Eimeria stiedai]
MLPDTVAAVAADAAVAVAAAAAAAAAQRRRSFPTGEPSFVDGTSYLLSGSSECDELSAAPQSPVGGCHAANENADAEDEWRGASPDQWRYLRLLSGHWSPWTVSLLALRRLPLPPAAWRELRACSSSLKLLVLENCGLSSAEFCCGLVNLQRLLLPHNQLPSLHGLKNLPRLQELCLKGNPIQSFGGLRALSGLPSLRRLDLQAFDGSEAAPVCKARGYEEAVLTLLPHEPATKAWGLPQIEPLQGKQAFADALPGSSGTRGCRTRLEILDGKRLHLPPLKLAVSEAITAATEAKAATRKFREGVRSVLKNYQIEQMPVGGAPTSRGLQKAAGCMREEAPRSSRRSSASLNQSEAARLPPLSSTSQWLVPAEACQAVRELLAREVQEALMSAQQVVQQVTRASLAAWRGVTASS